MMSLPNYFDLMPALKDEGITVGRNGEPYNLYEFDADYVTLETIAMSLAKTSRYLGNGHTFCSVARHCINGAKAFLLMGDVQNAKAFMLHDAGEAIYGDMSRPFKKIMEKKCPEIKEMTDAIDEAICLKYGVNWPLSPAIKEVDKNLAVCELTNEIWLDNAIEPADHIQRDYDDYLMTFRQILTFEAIAQAVEEGSELNLGGTRPKATQSMVDDIFIQFGGGTKRTLSFLERVDDEMSR